MWTRDGTIFFKKNNETKLHSVRGLYDGSFMLGQSVFDIQGCFSSNQGSGGTKSVSKNVETSCITEVSNFDNLHINSRSRSKHYEEIEAFISNVESPAHVIDSTQTRLRVDDEPWCYFINTYNRCSVNSRKKGRWW